MIFGEILAWYWSATGGWDTCILLPKEQSPLPWPKSTKPRTGPDKTFSPAVLYDLSLASSLFEKVDEADQYLPGRRGQMSREMPAREEKGERSEIAHPEQEGAAVCEERGKPRTGDERVSKGFRFDDPYWDDVFDSWHNPTLRTCCR